MTIREFADKYAVPYSLVYGASYRVKPVATLQRDKDYPEDKLYAEVSQILLERISYHRELMKKDIKFLDGMGMEVRL